MKWDLNTLVRSLIMMLVGIVMGGGMMGLWQGTRPAAIYIEPPLPTITPLPWQVYVSGAVNNPGVYQVDPDMIVADAVALAGGVTAAADQTGVNLALRVRDGLQVFVPVLGETTVLPTAPALPGETVDVVTPSAPMALINLNTATLEELDTLPGIGPSIAQRIVDYRTQNGAFTQIEDLMNVPGIGESKFNDIKMLITVGES
ncbi:MAG: helix-hairpin-helix domain-containing protein [Chloroflexi bacterium]|nr:helix-hairpin-helix domain-containing protein [Chloroflexota bacterium]MBP8056819.1 helix-hairpin-helix domain-containing protein [Chloroflexota bacterium]